MLDAEQRLWASKVVLVLESVLEDFELGQLMLKLIHLMIVRQMLRSNPLNGGYKIAYTGL